MSDQEEARTRILSALLNMQNLSSDVAPIDPSQLTELVDEQNFASREDRQRILSSPLYRAAVLNAISRRGADIADEFADYDLEILPLAANSAAESYVLSGEHYDLVIEQRDDEDCPWMISLQLKDPIRNILNGRQIRLLDRSGHEWITAVIDEAGEVNFGWYDREISPLERAIDCGVRIEVV